MEKRRPSIIKHENRIPLQEVEFPDFPDEDTVTTTVTKSRRVSFGGNFVKEFIVGSAVSTQFVSEYEQPFLSSDSSNANSSRSGILDESALNLCVKKHVLDDGYSPVKKKFSSDKHHNDIYERNGDENWDFNVNNTSNIFSEDNLNVAGKTELSRHSTKINKKGNHNDSSSMILDKQMQNKRNDSDINYSKLNETNNKNSKQGKFSSTICFSADSPTADMEFTEGCISLAKSIFEKKKKEMTVYIQAKDRENMKKEKTPNDTIHFEASAVEMSLTKCVQDMSDDSADTDMCLTRCINDKTNYSTDFSTCDSKCVPFPLTSDQSDDDVDDDIENVPPRTYLLNALLDQGDESEDDAEMERSLFFPERSLSDMLKSDPLKTSVLDEMEECDMDLSAVGPMKFSTAPEENVGDVVESDEKGPPECNTSTSTDSNMDLSLPVGRTVSPEFVEVESPDCQNLSTRVSNMSKTGREVDTTLSSACDMDLSAVGSVRVSLGCDAAESKELLPSINQTMPLEGKDELSPSDMDSAAASARVPETPDDQNNKGPPPNVKQTVQVESKDELPLFAMDLSAVGKCSISQGSDAPPLNEMSPKLKETVSLEMNTEFSIKEGQNIATSSECNVDLTDKASKEMSFKCNNTYNLESSVKSNKTFTLGTKHEASPSCDEILSKHNTTVTSESSGCNKAPSPVINQTVTLERNTEFSSRERPNTMLSSECNKNVSDMGENRISFKSDNPYRLESSSSNTNKTITLGRKEEASPSCDNIFTKFNTTVTLDPGVDISVATGIKCDATYNKDISIKVNGTIPLEKNIEEHEDVTLGFNVTVTPDALDLMNSKLSLQFDESRVLSPKFEETATLEKHADTSTRNGEMLQGEEVNTTMSSGCNVDVSADARISVSPQDQIFSKELLSQSSQPLSLEMDMEDVHQALPEPNQIVSSELNMDLSDVDSRSKHSPTKINETSNMGENGECINEVGVKLNETGNLERNMPSVTSMRNSPICDINGSSPKNKASMSLEGAVEVSSNRGDLSAQEQNETASSEFNMDLSNVVGQHKSSPTKVNETSNLGEDECTNESGSEMNVTRKSESKMDLSLVCNAGILPSCDTNVSSPRINESVPLEGIAEFSPETGRESAAELNIEPSESNMELSAIMTSPRPNEKLSPKISEEKGRECVDTTTSSDYNRVDVSECDRNSLKDDNDVGLNKKLNNDVDKSLVRNKRHASLEDSGVQSKPISEKELSFIGMECDRTPVRSSRSSSQPTEEPPGTGTEVMECDGENRTLYDSDVSFQDRRKRARPFFASITDSDMKPRHKEKRVIKSYTECDMDLTWTPAPNMQIHADQTLDVSMDSTRDLFSASELFPSVSDQDSMEDETSLGDKKTIHVLKEQSEEANCCWTMEDTVQDDSTRLWTFIFPLMYTTARVEFNLKPATDKSLFSFSTVLSRSVHLAQTGEPRRGMPRHHLEKDKATMDFGFDRLKSYVKKGTRNMDTVQNMPLFVDQLNLFVTKLNLVLKQVGKILKEYPGSRLNRSVLTFRLYSFPLMFSCAIALDLREPVHMTEASVAVKFHFGDFSLTEIKSVFRECLGREDALVYFIRSITDLVIQREGEGGFITNRSLIRLLR